MPGKKLYSTNGIVYSTDSNFKTEQKAEEGTTLPVQDQLLKVSLDAKHRGGKIFYEIKQFANS